MYLYSNLAVLTHFDHDVFIVNRFFFSKNGLRYIILLPILLCIRTVKTSRTVFLPEFSDTHLHPVTAVSSLARRHIRYSASPPTQLCRDRSTITILPDTRGVSYCGRFSVWNYICTQTECNIFEVQAEQSIWNKSVIHGWMGRGEGTGLYLASPAGRLACSTARAKTETRNR